MARKIIFTIDDEILNKPDMASRLNNESVDGALEYCVSSYIAKTFRVAAENIGGDSNFDEVSEFYDKAFEDNNYEIWRGDMTEPAVMQYVDYFHQQEQED